MNLRAVSLARLPCLQCPHHLLIVLEAKTLKILYQYLKPLHLSHPKKYLKGKAKEIPRVLKCLRPQLLP